MLDKITGGKNEVSGHGQLLAAKFSCGIFFPWKMPFCGVQVLCRDVLGSGNLPMAPKLFLDFLAASSRLGSWAGRDVLLENLLWVTNLIAISACHAQGNIPHNLNC